MAYKKLNLEHHVARNISKQRWRVVNGKPIVLQQAFKLRPKEKLSPGKNNKDETSLSCAWNEYFSGSLIDQTKRCLDAMVNGGLVVRQTNAIAVCNVGMLEGCGKNHKLSIKAFHKPNAKNPAKAGIDGMRIDNQSDDLLSEIASTAVVMCVKVVDL